MASALIDYAESSTDLVVSPHGEIPVVAVWLDFSETAVKVFSVLMSQIKIFPS
jgi:hypothetical protein